MSLELASEKWLDGDPDGLLGPFASTQGYTDLIKAARTPVLKKFFEEGATEDVAAACKELRALAKSASKDIADTAIGMAKMMDGLPFAMITNGEMRNGNGIPADEGKPTKKAAAAELPEEVAKSIPDEAGRGIFQRALAARNGDSDVHAYLKAYRALEDAGYDYDEVEKSWKVKSDDQIIPADGLLRKDDPGTEEVDVPALERELDNEDDEGDENLPPVDEGDRDKVTKRISGNSDIPLNTEGEDLAEKLAERIALRGGLDTLYSSPLPRAVETADAIADACEGMK